MILVAGTVLITGGELFSSAGSWGMSYAQAPDDQQAEYLAAFGLAGQAAQVGGPLVAALVVSHGLVGWLTAGVVFAVAGLLSPAVAARGRSAEACVGVSAG